jgi:carbonic anhydrase/acetyltransferase-like protein (isoleucine patch superfamily)
MNPANKKDIYRFMDRRPRVGARVYLDPMASVSGDVELGDDVSVWPMVVIRGDVNRIVIGARTNIQDGSILHVTHESHLQPKGMPLLIGADVTIGHGAILHACTVGDRSLVGMGASVLDGAVLEPDSMIAAGALIPPGKTVRSGTLWRGNPARFARDLTAREIADLEYNAAHYVRLKNRYLEEPR